MIRVKGGLPFEADFQVKFVVEEKEECAVLHVFQTGFPDGAEADDFYAACDNGWAEVLENIRSFLR